jgi:hypothetical protein
MRPQLSRLIIIFGVLILAFIIVRWVLRPESFYQYGHYRGKALIELSTREPRYVDRKTCAECHDEQTAQNAAGPHSHVSCQTCHGPGDHHIAEPSTSNIHRPKTKEICVRCHEANKARPAKFPQIEMAEHGDGAKCESCHTVHNPGEIH